MYPAMMDVAVGAAVKVPRLSNLIQSTSIHKNGPGVLERAMDLLFGGTIVGTNPKQCTKSQASQLCGGGGRRRR